MRTLCVLVALGAMLVVCPKLYAQEARERLGERIQDLHLTAQQETKIADIRKEYQPKVKEAVDALKADVKKEVEMAEAVLTPEQKSQLAALKEDRREDRTERREGREARLAERVAHLQQLDLTDDEKAKMKAIHEEFQPKIEKVMESLKGTLTSEQLQSRREALRAGKNRAEVIKALHLTGDQKEKVEAVGSELRTLVREELEKIRDVLSESQQAKLQDFRSERKEHVRDQMTHRIMHAKELNLTDSQNTQLMEIRKEYRPKVHEEGDKLRATAREEIEAIVAVLKV
jgi:Spy/CpxP family protein refolding chaperone